MKLSKLFSCLVVNAMSEGFRRGGHKLAQGKNELELDEEQVALFERDPNMTIEVLGEVALDTLKTAAVTKVSEMSGASATTVADVVDSVEQAIKESQESKNKSSLEIDLSGAPETLAPIIASIHLLAAESADPLTKRPSCKELAFTVDVEGVDKLITPSADDANDAWKWYVDNAIPQLNKKEQGE